MVNLAFLVVDPTAAILQGSGRCFAVEDQGKEIPKDDCVYVFNMNTI